MILHPDGTECRVTWDGPVCRTLCGQTEHVLFETYTEFVNGKDHANLIGRCWYNDLKVWTRSETEALKAENEWYDIFGRFPPQRKDAYHDDFE